MLTNPILILLLSLAIALLGSTAHWAKRWARGQTGASFADYLFGEPKHTIASFGALVGAVSVFLASGHVDFGSVDTFGELLLTGYTIDSAVNKAPDD